MTITQPTRLTFWRLIFGVSALLPFLSTLQLLDMAVALGVDISASRSWMGAMLGLGVMCAVPLLFWALTGSSYRERILSLAEFPQHLPDHRRWIAVLFLLVSVTGFTLFLKLTFLSFLIWMGWFRVLVFWYFSLIGLLALKSIRRDAPWMTSLLCIAICQAVFHLLLVYWTRVTDYPLAMGWSETSRFYYPSLFLAETVYGRDYAWPILHPTLHLLLAPPYLLDASLWAHRFWQVAIRYILVGAIVPVLLRRLFIQSFSMRWIVGLWMFLFLFMGPIYFHLAIPVILMLWGFSQENDRRTWIAVILASIWCGWSRVNWYPMPGMIAAVLYLMACPIKGKNVWQYLLKPALWFVLGNDCMTILDLEGSVLYLNPRGQQLLEIDDLASYRHTSWLDVWQGADKAAATLALQQAKDGGPGAFQGFCPTTGGRPKWWDVALTPMRDAEGTVERLLVVSRDISERKKAEALRTGQSRVLEMIATNEPLEDILASLACLMESHAEGMFCSVLLLDDDGLHVRHGAAPSLPESYTKCIDGISIGPQVGSCGTAMYRAEPVIVSDILEDPLWENYRELANAHGLRACWSAPIFSSQGQVLGSFAMYYREPRSPLPAERELIDIATHIAAIAIAHRRAEKALRASEERSRAILRAIPDAMFLMTSDGVYLDFHTTNLNELLVQPDQFLGKNMRDVLPPELAEKLAVSFRSALESNEPQSLEYALELKGQEQSYEARIVRTNGDQLLSVVRNITERKLAEEALRLSERRFRQLAENIRAVFFVTEVGNGTAPGRILYVSPAYETIWGRSCDSLYRDTRSWLEAVHPDDRKRLEPELPNLTKGEFDEEFRIVRTGGEVRWVHSRVFPVLDARGKVYRVTGIVDDITERKHAEEALRDREERLRLTCEAGRMGVWDWDIAANKVVWSKDIFSILGLEPLSIQPNYGNWAERIHPDDLSRVEEALNAAIRGNGSYQAEYRIIWPDGTIRWTEGRGRSTYNEAGDCISMQGLMIDITERKQAEEALRESEERYRNVVETQTELICRNLPDTTLTFVNDAYCRYFNRTREELIGTKFLELIPEAVHLAVLRHVEALMESRSPDTSEHEHEVIRPDGSVGWQQWVNRKIFDPAGRVIEVQGIGRDITERKLAENALRESEERYRNVVETQTELICRYQCDTTLTFVNDAYCRYFGKTREQLIGIKFLELMPEEARPAAVTHVESLIANPRIETDEHEVIRADGTIGWQQWVDYAIRDADGTIMEMQAIGRDITERKRLEEDLQGREREFATLVENSPDIISRLDRDLRFLYVSPIVERVLGVPPQHFIGKTTREVGTPPHDWDAFESSCRQAFETGEIVDREFSYGGRHYHSRLIPEFGTGSSVDSVMCISEDTTERRRAEQELVQMSGRLLGLQEEERRRIARQLHDVTAQNLFATTINLARLQSPAVSSEVKEVLAECQSLCEQALQEIRTLSYILHPPILDQAGLVSALRWYIDGFSKRSGIDVGLVVTREFDRLPREVEADLFRIVQESLANVHRHSGSITARVRLEKQATQVVVQIRDEGHGMQRDKTRLEADESTLGVGIPGMRHRLRQLGGNLTIESNSHGTTVMATVPLRVERRERSRASHGSG